MHPRLAATTPLAAGLSLAAAVSFAVAGPAAADTAGGVSYRWVGNSTDRAADNHSWTDPHNWAPNGVPGNGDSVRIEGPVDACTATVDSVPAVSLSALEIVPGTSRFGDPCFVSLTGGAVTVTTNFLWSGGTIENDLTLAAGASGRIADVTYPLVQRGDVSVHGELTVSGTDVDVNGDGESDRALLIERPHRLTVESDGYLQSLGDNVFTYLSCCVAPGRLVNKGVVEVRDGSLELDHLAFDQSGTLQVPTPGSALVSEGGIANAAPGSRYHGPGEWRLRSTVQSHFSGTQQVGDAFQLNLGTTGSDTSGSQFGGTFTVAGSGRLGWYGGALEAGVTIGKGVRFEISGRATGNNARLLGGRDYTPGGAKSVAVVNHGHTYVGDGASFETTDVARLINATDGRLDLAPGTRIEAQRCCVAPDAIVNQGVLALHEPLLAAAAPKPVVLRNVAFRNDGRVTLPTGGDLQIVGGAPVTLARSSVTGGRLLLDAPTTVLGGTTLANRPTIGLTGATLDLRGTTAVRGYAVFAGGTVINRDVLTVSAGRASRLSFTGAFTQVRGATTVLDAGRHGVDVLAVSKRAAIAGTVQVRNAARWAPANGTRVTVVSATGGVSWSGRVVTVRGWIAPRANHWVAGRTARTLTLTARAG